MDGDIVLSTTIKHVKRFIAVLCAISIIIPTGLVAAPKTAFEMGMEAKEGAKWKQAKSYFESITQDSPDYGRALDELATIGELQKSDRESRKTIHQGEQLKARLDRGVEKCLQLFKHGSPEAHKCVTDLSLVQNEVSALINTDSYKHAGLKELDDQLVPFRKFDEVALPVTKVRPTLEDLDRASEKILALEQYIENRDNPRSLIALGTFVLSQYHLGGARAHVKDCDVLRSRGEGDSESARIICGFAEQARIKYGEILSRLDPGTLIDGPPIPSITYGVVAPIKHDDLPSPKVVTSVFVDEVKTEIPPKTKAKKKKKGKVIVTVDETSSWVQTAIYVGVPVVITIATWMWWKNRAPYAPNPALQMVANQLAAAPAQVAQQVVIQLGANQISVAQDVANKFAVLQTALQVWLAGDGTNLPDIKAAAAAFGLTVAQAGGKTRPRLTANVVNQIGITAELALQLCVYINSFHI